VNRSLAGPIQFCRRRARRLLVVAVSLPVVACALQRVGTYDAHRWWAGLGPVLPHDSFPADCTLCHLGSDWNTLREDFEFDHARETGVPLSGAHRAAQCLRCHNDRGPVATFSARGCAGCHEDVHEGQLGTACQQCHTEQSWMAVGQIERHAQTRFPLVGVHAVTACYRCHPGAEVGQFVPTDPDCVSCHQRDLLGAQNPNHIAFGWVTDCDRCHLPTTWNQAEIDG
jgi:hypothetical protein